MYTKEALRNLGVTAADFTDDERLELDRNGFYIRTGVFTAAECREMADEFDRLHQAEGNKGGHEVHVEPGAPRVSNIFNKTTVFDRCLAVLPALAASAYLLGEFKLHGANLRNPERARATRTCTSMCRRSSSTTGGSPTPSLTSTT